MSLAARALHLHQSISRTTLQWQSYSWEPCLHSEPQLEQACQISIELQRLFKGKGNRLEMKANRFLHMKGWGPKVYEKMLMTKMESKMFKNTPEFQVGGQKLGSTNEHLAAMITVMRRLEKTQGLEKI